MNSISPQTLLNEKNYWRTSAALVIGMLTGAAMTLLSLLSQIVPDWQPTYLPVLAAFAAFERLFTYHRTRKLTLFSKAWIISTTTEWVVIGLFIKVIAGLSRGSAVFRTEIEHWATDFPASFFTPDFLFALGLVIIVWFLSGSFAELIDGMGLKQALILQEVSSAQAETQTPRERLLSLITSLGAVLIVFTALVRVDLRTVFAQPVAAIQFRQLPALAGGGASTLFYFMLGLALLSQSQFMDLHTRWSLLQIPISTGISQRWTLFSLVFFGILAGMVALLPTSYSLGVLGWLGTGLGFIARAIFLIGQMLLGVLLFLLSLPFYLFGNKSPLPTTPAPLPPTPAPPANLPVNTPPAAWLETLKSAAFWVILAAILVFSIIQYLRQHREIFQALSKFPAGRQLAKLLRLLRIFWQGTAVRVSGLMQAGRDRLGKPAGARRLISVAEFINLRRLDPRQKVTFYYLALLRRGNEQGLARRMSQTPQEYASTLETALPEVETEIDSLTAAFTEARYSRHPLAAEQANQAQAFWERIKKSLRKRMHQ